MTRYGALFALTVALFSCMSSDRSRGGGGGTGGEEEGGTGGSTNPTGMGGSTGTGGKATGGATGTGGSSSGGSGGGADASPDAATAAWPNCLEPVFSGVMPSEFCMVYAKVCTFTGTSHYASMADCMAKFKGGSSDGDACKSGHLCRAATNPAMKEADCASSGTASCRN